MLSLEHPSICKNCCDSLPDYSSFFMLSMPCEKWNQFRRAKEVPFFFAHFCAICRKLFYNIKNGTTSKMRKSADKLAIFYNFIS